MRIRALVMLLSTLFWPRTVLCSDKKPSTSASDLSVCQVLSRLTKLRDKVVTVNGFLYASTEIVAIGGLNCSDPFRTGKYVWPTALSVRSTATLTDLDRECVAIRSNIGRRVRVTLTGTLRTMKKYTVIQTDAGPRGLGFGHLGLYPAELDVAEVTSIEVLEPGSTRQ